ncbi:MAG: hypothetical protein KKC21_04645 [Nitrospinae bacterium]|nr:hypothetical protein [Nitrospinota bacterium]
MFEKLSYNQSELIYLGLKKLIETKSGHGLHNADGGHPVYVNGSQGKINKQDEYADSPDKSALFKMLSELSTKLKKDGVESHGFKWWYDFNNWQSFCKFIINSYQKQSGSE